MKISNNLFSDKLKKNLSIINFKTFQKLGENNRENKKIVIKKQKTFHERLFKKYKLFSRKNRMDIHNYDKQNQPSSADDNQNHDANLKERILS